MKKQDNDARSFKNKVLAFSGDSITYGYDPVNPEVRMANPWPQQVGAKLGVARLINYGVCSGSVMLGDDVGLWAGPMAMIDQYHEYADDIDIFGFMIGINDCNRGYPLGKWGDRERTTFYGAFYMLLQGLIQKYCPNEHKLFMILYPIYAGKERWPEFLSAMKTTARHFSIPYLDLSEKLGISIYADTKCVYWPGDYDKPLERDCHPTQLCADLIADCVANFIQSHFSI